MRGGPGRDGRYLGGREGEQAVGTVTVRPMGKGRHCLRWHGSTGREREVGQAGPEDRWLIPEKMDSEAFVS